MAVAGSNPGRILVSRCDKACTVDSSDSFIVTIVARDEREGLASRRARDGECAPNDLWIGVRTCHGIQARPPDGVTNRVRADFAIER
jgi:hypothetical protein